MKNDFTKVFDIEGYQVSVEKVFSPHEDNKHEISQTTILNGLEFCLKIGFNDEETRNNLFDEYDHKHAIDFLELGGKIINC